MTNETRNLEFDTRLIKCVKSFSALYNRSDPINSTNNKKLIWRAISEQLKTNELFCSKSWTRIRDRYALLLKRELLTVASATIKWPYYEMCSFLLKHTQVYGHLKNLIKTVRMYPILYDKNDKDYGNPDQVKLLWRKIAKHINSRPEVCAKEWDELYKKYVNEHIKKSKQMLSRNSSRSILRKWVYFKDLEFLKEHIDLDYFQSVEKTITTFDSDTIDNISNCSNDIFQDDFWNRPPVLCDKITSDKMFADNNINFLDNVKLDYNYAMQFSQVLQEPKEELDSSLKETISVNNQNEKMAITSENNNISHSPTTTLCDVFNLQINSGRQQSESENTTFDPNNIERSTQMENLIQREEIMEDEDYCPLLNSIPKEDFLNNIQMEDQQKAVSTSEIMNPTDFGSKFFHDEDIERKKQNNIVKENKTLQNLDDKIENGNNTSIACDIKFFTEFVACKITDFPETYRNNAIRQIKKYLELQDI